MEPRASSSRKSRVVVLAAVLAVGCDTYEGVQLCGEIPEGGCPAGRGGSCDDVVCTGLFDCVEGQWTEVEPCPDNVSSTAVSTGADGAGGDGAGGCAIPELDRSGEVDGCTPDLLEPDCPASAAEICGPCETGCADFFLCTADGWVDVAACTGDGFVVVPR